MRSYAYTLIRSFAKGFWGFNFGSLTSQRLARRGQYLFPDANMIGQHGMGRKRGQPPIRYEAVEEGLRRVAEFATERNAAVHMPRIGCGLAGGSWEEIAPIIDRSLVASGVEVTVYDFG